MNQLRRQMVELCRDVASLDDPKTAGIARRASQLLPQIEPKPSKVKAANRKRRRTKVEQQSEETSAIRRQVIARAHGLGELCLKPLIPGLEQMAHLNGGNGRRIQEQSIENCVAEHEKCHKSVDRDPLMWLPEVQAWCVLHGYPLPRRFHVLAALRGVNIHRTPPTHRKPDHGTEPAF